MSQKIKEIVFGKNVVEFVTVAVQYCAILESFEDKNRLQIVDKMTKILPLLYLKASMLAETELLADNEPEITVTEDWYNQIFSRLFALFGKDDTYLEVFLQDMKYSDTPIGASIAEDLTDIYQDLKNFITIYERGISENMNDAMLMCHDNFKAYWGQKLVNVLRALHGLKYPIGDDEGLSNDSHNEEQEDYAW